MATASKIAAARARKASAPAMEQAPDGQASHLTSPKDEEPQETGARSYVVLDNLHHDGRRYSLGCIVELTGDQAAALPAGIVLAEEE